MYGFDIFLFYCFGDWTCSGIFRSIQLLKLNCWRKNIFDESMMVFEKFNEKDRAKTQEIVDREYFKLVNECQNSLDPLRRKMVEIYQ